jgi:hypothetical protein
MTNLEKLEANDKREEIFSRDNWTCQSCGKSIYTHGTPQLAHKICKSKANLKKYGSEIINHSLNLVSVCSIGACNDKWNCDKNIIEKEKLIDEILAAIDRGEK